LFNFIGECILSETEGNIVLLERLEELFQHVD